MGIDKAQCGSTAHERLGQWMAAHGMDKCERCVRPLTDANAEWGNREGNFGPYRYVELRCQHCGHPVLVGNVERSPTDASQLVDLHAVIDQLLCRYPANGTWVGGFHRSVAAEPSAMTIYLLNNDAACITLNERGDTFDMTVDNQRGYKIAIEALPKRRLIEMAIAMLQVAKED